MEFSYEMFFGTLGNENRLKIIRYLSKNGTRNVTQISRGTKLEQSAVSHNLKRLLLCQFVHISQNGKARLYSLNSQTIKPLIGLIDRHVIQFCKKSCKQCWLNDARTSAKTS